MVMSKRVKTIVIGTKITGLFVTVVTMVMKVMGKVMKMKSTTKR